MYETRNIITRKTTQYRLVTRQPWTINGVSSISPRQELHQTIKAGNFIDGLLYRTTDRSEAGVTQRLFKRTLSVSDGQEALKGRHGILKALYSTNDTARACIVSLSRYISSIRPYLRVLIDFQ